MHPLFPSLEKVFFYILHFFSTKFLLDLMQRPSTILTSLGTQRIRKTESMKTVHIAFYTFSNTSWNSGPCWTRILGVIRRNKKASRASNAPMQTQSIKAIHISLSKYLNPSSNERGTRPEYRRKRLFSYNWLSTSDWWICFILLFWFFYLFFYFLFCFFLLFLILEGWNWKRRYWWNYFDNWKIDFGFWWKKMFYFFFFSLFFFFNSFFIFIFIC
jgi:hypothetical protein